MKVNLLGDNAAMRLFVRVWLKMLALAVVVCTLLRVALLINQQTVEVDFTAVGWLEIFLVGAINDMAVMSLGYLFLWLFMMLAFEQKYRKPYGYVVFGVMVAGFLYTTFAHTMLDDYGSVAPLVGSLLTALFALNFGVKLFAPRWRRGMLRFGFGAWLLTYVSVIIFNMVSEYIFWDEFGVRYNFIAVDYLIYTNEVIGNIMESYPIIPMASVLMVVCSAVAWLLFRGDVHSAEVLVEGGWSWRGRATLLYVVVALLSFATLRLTAQLQHTPNVYLNELQANGVYRFFEAFMKNNIDYKQFYPTLDDDDAKQLIYAEYGSTEDNCRVERGDSVEQRPNIVLITIESMSASFLERYGNTQHLTPNLDTLCRRGIVFDNLFATGNRTVRGLEAVTLSLPPCPGQSIIKREDHANMHSTARMLKEQKGYDVTYFYGGKSYFDNMQAFFGSNHYAIIDRNSYSSSDITFENIWGVCDEDAYRMVIRELGKKHTADSDASFFAHVMTVSNHRPYTYPKGKISISPESKVREGGVMYSDYALGRFFEMAEREPWFENTVFVITADHCASSAGKIEIPLDKYRIPAVIYAPNRFAPQVVEKTCSQIDIMPTLFALLGMEYESHFYGRNIFDEEYPERAFIATYQDLGYLQNDTLTIFSPRNSASRKSLSDGVKQYHATKLSDSEYRMTAVERIDEGIVRRAAAYYQTSYLWN